MTQIVQMRVIPLSVDAVPNGIIYCLGRVYALTMLYNLNYRSSLKHRDGSANTNEANSLQTRNTMNITNGICECLHGILRKSDCHPPLRCASYGYCSLWVIGEVTRRATYSPSVVKLMFASRLKAQWLFQIARRVIRI